MNSKIARTILFCLMVVSLLVSCRPSTEAFLTPTLTSIPSESIPTFVSASQTLTPTEAREEIITPTTEIPILSTAEAIIFVENLLRSNNGCRLPCWWGFNPGQTSWEEAYQFIKPFALGYKKVEPAELLAQNIRRPFITQSFLIPVSKEIASSYPPEAFLLDENNIIQIIDAYPGYTPNYSLFEILSEYGKPEDFFIRTVKNEYEGYLPFELYLYYSSQGIIAGYLVQGKIEGSAIQGCPKLAAYPRLFLWSPSKSYSFLDMMKIMGFYDENWEFLPLEKATSLDVGAFFNTYKESGIEACFKTPRSLWPHYRPP